MTPVSTAPLKQYRAPSHDLGLLIEPGLKDCLALARQNEQQLNAANCRIGSQPLSEFRQQARAALLQLSRQFLSHLGSPISETNTKPLDVSQLLFVTGHQPLLAHPGVWAKNIAVNALADKSASLALNLIVDNDIVTRTSLDVPAGNADWPRLEPLPFDDLQPQQPWEELHVRNGELWQTFADRVAQVTRRWGIETDFSKHWQQIVHEWRTAPQTPVWQLLTKLRLAVLGRQRQQTLELPISLLSESSAFQQFTAHVLRHVESFRAVHNHQLDRYRELHGIRSARQPVPALSQQGDWIEAPLWVWRAGDSRRQPLFVRHLADSIELSARGELIGRIDSTGDSARPVQLTPEWKLRPRALLTTLFTRLACSSLFIHGIGGAKYDEVTDGIIEQWLGITPPRFAVVTATLYLPLPSYAVRPVDEHILIQRVRDLLYNGEHALGGPLVTQRVQRRQELVEQAHLLRIKVPAANRSEQQTRRRQVHFELVAIREQLAQLAAEPRRQLSDQLASTRRQLAANRILRSREFAAILFPSAKLNQLSAAILAELP